MKSNSNVGNYIIAGVAAVLSIICFVGMFFN